MKDSNGSTIRFGDMVTFKDDAYNKLLGIVSRVLHHSNSVYVSICGGGAMGSRLLLGKNVTKVEGS